MSHITTSIPSPNSGVLQLGPIPLRGYAVMIIIGISVAVWLGNKRWIARGGLNGQVAEVAMWAVPFGVIGGRLYHVLTDWSAYFGTNGRGFWATFEIWKGGLGIWGAIALGGVGAYIGCVRQGMALAPFADAVAPGIVFAQAIGRWGNWFNQELFGKPTTVPWALQIDVQHRPEQYINYETFHPTFLYESIACAAIGFFLLWADRKYVYGHGRLFAVYVALYCAARGVIETMRIDEANHIFGIRLNVFTSIIIGIGAVVYYIRSMEKRPGQELIERGLVVGERSPQEALELKATQREERAQALAEKREQQAQERQQREADRIARAKAIAYGQELNDSQSDDSVIDVETSDYEQVDVTALNEGTDEGDQNDDPTSDAQQSSTAHSDSPSADTRDSDDKRKQTSGLLKRKPKKQGRRVAPKE